MVAVMLSSTQVDMLAATEELELVCGTSGVSGVIKASQVWDSKWNLVWMARGGRGRRGRDGRGTVRTGSEDSQEGGRVGKEREQGGNEKGGTK